MVGRRKADRHIAAAAGIGLVAVFINFADPAERYLIGIAQVNFIIILPHARRPTVKLRNGEILRQMIALPRKPVGDADGQTAAVLMGRGRAFGIKGFYVRVVMKNLRGGRRVAGEFYGRKSKPQSPQTSRRQQTKGQKRHRYLQAKLVIIRAARVGFQMRVLHEVLGDNQNVFGNRIFAISLQGLAVFRALKVAATIGLSGLAGNVYAGISECTATLERDIATARCARASTRKGRCINLNCEQGGDCDKHRHVFFSFSSFIERYGFFFAIDADGEPHHAVAGQCKIILF